MLIILTLSVLLAVQPITNLFAMDSMDSTGTAPNCAMVGDDCNCSSDSICQQQHCADSFNIKTYTTMGYEFTWPLADQSFAASIYLTIPSAPYFELLRPPRI